MGDQDAPAPDFLLPYSLLVFFNAKFDLHWYRRIGIKIPNTRIWCCQLAEYYLSGQTITYASLEDTAVKYGLGNKIDVIKKEYWDKGINTDQIPRAILSEYAIQDVALTHQIYLKQLEEFKKNPALYQLFRLACMDLLVLEEMEWNGLPYNEEMCNQKSLVLQKQIKEITDQLNNVYPDIPINFNSPDQLSAFLYGGQIKQVVKEVIGVYKTGLHKGEIKYGNKEIVHVLPRLVEPLAKSEMSKEGVFSTNEGTLRKLKGVNAKKYVQPLLDLARLDKLDGTYYKGLIKLNKEMNWPAGMLHGQFNQVVARTGRLSSSRP